MNMDTFITASLFIGYISWLLFDLNYKRQHRDKYLEGTRIATSKSHPNTPFEFSDNNKN